MYPRRLYPEALRNVAYGSITTSYAAVGSAVSKPARIIRWVNNTDQLVYISWDGSTDHMYLPKKTFILLDVTTNKVRDDGLFVALGTKFYVKYDVVPPSEGSVVIEVYIALGGEQDPITPVPA